MEKEFNKITEEYNEELNIINKNNQELKFLNNNLEKKIDELKK